MAGPPRSDRRPRRPGASRVAVMSVASPASALAGSTLPGERLIGWAQTLHAFAQTRPWVVPVCAAALLGMILVGHATRTGVMAWRHRQLSVHAQEIQIIPPPEVDPAGAGLWWANLAGLLRPAPWRRLIYGPAHLGLEYRWTGRQMQIIVWVPGTVPAGPVAAAARAAWPGASTRIEDATAPLPAPPTPALPAGAGDTPGGPGVASPRAVLVREAGAALVAAMPAWSPLASRADQPLDPLRALVAAGSGLHAEEQACVQVLARPAARRRVTRALSAAAALKTGRPAGGTLSPERILSGALSIVADLLSPTHGPARPTTAAGHRAGSGDPLRERDARPGLEKLSGPQWEVAIRIGVSHASTRSTRAKGTSPGSAPSGGVSAEVVSRRLTVMAHALTSALAVHDARNRLRRLRLSHPRVVLASRVMRAGFLLSTPELAALAGLPTDLAVAGLDRARARAVPAPIAVPAGGRGMKVLGRAQVGGHSVALPVVDSREHVHVLGSTGAGKSTWLTHLILDDIRARRATILIDPKGDLARDVLDRMSVADAERLVLIDPDQPVGSATFNPLQLRPGADADLIVDNIVAIFAAIFQRHWGPRIDDVLRVACLTVMRHRDPTLLTVPPLLNNKQFRAPFTVGFDDPEGLKGFWEWFESTPPALRAQVIGPVLARLRSFLLRDFVRNTIGPARGSFDMGTVLDRGGILIARLPKGQLGEDTARLLGSLIFASVWQAATARARLPETRRKDAAIYVDEAHNILNLGGSVSDMLAEARGYRLSMVLAHQHLAQLPRDTQLALSANARNKIFFNCSPEDSRQLALHTQPELDEHDLSHLDAYIAAARLIIGNRETSAFTLATNPPRPETGQREQVRAVIARAATARTQEPTVSPENDEPEPAETSPQTGERRSASGPPGPAGPTGHTTTSRSGSTTTRRRPGRAPSEPPDAPASPDNHPTSTKPQAGDHP
jgi:hypothetical protein